MRTYVLALVPAMCFATSCAARTAAPPPPPRAVMGDAGLRGEVVTDGPLAARLAAPDEADLVIVYGGEARGSMEPCGCPERPRGGLARFAAYRDAVVAARPEVPVLTVDGGRFLEDAMGLDGHARLDVPVLNRWMIAGMQTVGYDAINLAYGDMMPTRDLVSPPPDDGAPRPGCGAPPVPLDALPLVSANLRGDPVEPWLQVERPGTDGQPLRIAIVGLGARGVAFLATPGFQPTEPFAAGKKAILDAAPDADVVVLLAHGDQDAARRLALDPQAGPHLDVVIDTDLHREVYPVIRVGQAVWVRSHYQTMRVGELRLGLERQPDGTFVTWAVERKIDLDAQVPDRSDLAGLAALARHDIDAAQKLVFGKSGY